MEMLQLMEASLVASWQEWWLLKQESRTLWLPCSGHPVLLLGPEMLKRSDALICENQYICTNNWRSIFQSAKDVLVTPFEILDIWLCVWCGFLGVSQLDTKQWEGPFLLSCCMFWSWGRVLLIPDCYIRWNLGPSFLTGEKKAVHGLAPSSISLEEKIHKVSERGRSWSLSPGMVKEWFLWMWWCEMR